MCKPNQNANITDIIFTIQHRIARCRLTDQQSIQKEKQKTADT